NTSITSPRKIDSLKRACFFFYWINKLLQTYPAISFYDKRVPRIDFLDFINRHIERSLYCRPLRSHDNNFIILIVKRRSNTGRIAHHKSISMSEYPVNCITTIPGFSRSSQDISDIEVLCNKLANFNVGISLFFKLIK